MGERRGCEPKLDFIASSTIPTKSREPYRQQQQQQQQQQQTAAAMKLQ